MDKMQSQIHSKLSLLKIIQLFAVLLSSQRNYIKGLFFRSTYGLVNYSNVSETITKGKLVWQEVSVEFNNIRLSMLPVFAARLTGSFISSPPTLVQTTKNRFYFWILIRDMKIFKRANFETLGAINANIARYIRNLENIYIISWRK